VSGLPVVDIGIEDDPVPVSPDFEREFGVVGDRVIVDRDDRVALERRERAVEDQRRVDVGLEDLDHRLDVAIPLFDLAIADDLGVAAGHRSHVGIGKVRDRRSNRVGCEPRVTVSLDDDLVRRGGVGLIQGGRQSSPLVLPDERQLRLLTAGEEGLHQLGRPVVARVDDDDLHVLHGVVEFDQFLEFRLDDGGLVVRREDDTHRWLSRPRVGGRPRWPPDVVHDEVDQIREARQCDQPEQGLEETFHANVHIHSIFHGKTGLLALYKMEMINLFNLRTSWRREGHLAL